MQALENSTNVLHQSAAIAQSVVGAWKRWEQQGPGPIGIDFAHDGIHAVQLCTHNKHGTQLLATASTPYPTLRSQALASPDLMTPVLKKLITDGNFSGNKAVIASPTGEAKTLSFSLKKNAQQDVSRQVVDLVNERLGGETKRWLIDYTSVEFNSKRQHEVHLVAAALERQSSIDFMHALSDAGLYLQAVEIPALALQRVLQHLEDVPKSCMVINMTRYKSYLSLFVNRSLVLEREISMGSNNFIEQLSASLSTDSATTGALLRTQGLDNRAHIFAQLAPTFALLKAEVDRMNDFLAAKHNGNGIEQILTFGESSRWPDFSTAFSKSLGHTTTVLEPQKVIVRNNHRINLSGLSTRLTVATGLAMRRSN